MLNFDAQRVRANVREATTEDLLDRVTVYRAGMEPHALVLIEAELRERGVDPHQIEAHAQRRESHAYLLPDGTATPCSFCRRPAVAHGWGWHRLWGVLPLFPRFVFWCEEHRASENLPGPPSAPR